MAERKLLKLAFEAARCANKTAASLIEFAGSVNASVAELIQQAEKTLTGEGS
jgi:hypothetical protein